jgi:hypothetical protein
MIGGEGEGGRGRGGEPTAFFALINGTAQHNRSPRASYGFNRYVWASFLLVNRFFALRGLSYEIDFENVDEN